MLNEKAIQEIAKAEATTAARESVVAAMHELSDSAGLAALPNDFTVHDLEKFQPVRRHARGVMSTTHIEHFANYTKVHADTGCTVFVSNDIKATAVLNLGDLAAPGHADNTAVLELAKTAAYTSLLSMDGKTVDQRTAVEWLEDWAQDITCRATDSDVPTARAIAAIRKLTIEAARKVESNVQALSESRSAFEEVTASSSDPVPEFITFKCEPYQGLEARQFDVRISVLTSDKPMVVLRVKQLQKHVEEMSDELAKKVTAALSEADGISVVLGKYARGS